jgi:ABC-type uncharacterized transport system involved in gliding motility auxiliary subunit
MTFLENVAEWLSNEDDLLEIKTRATRDLRLNAIPDPGVKASVATFAEVFNVVVVPIVVIAFGVIRYLRRREKIHGRTTDSRTTDSRTSDTRTSGGEE